MKEEPACCGPWWGGPRGPETAEEAAHSPFPQPLAPSPRPWGSGPFSHLTVCAGDRTPLFSKPLVGPQAPSASLCPPSLSPPGLCSGSFPAWNPHSSQRALLTATAASLQGLPPPWGPERGCRGRWEATGPRTVSRASLGVGLGTPGPSRHPEPCSAQGGSMTQGGQAQAPHGGPLPRSPRINLSTGRLKPRPLMPPPTPRSLSLPHPGPLRPPRPPSACTLQ